MSKIEIKNVFEADNGDVFVLRKIDYKEHTQEEVNEFLEEAKKMYKEGNFKKCEYKDAKYRGEYWFEKERF